MYKLKDAYNLFSCAYKLGQSHSYFNIGVENLHRNNFRQKKL